MIKKKETGTLVVISGPSGAGKGTICRELVKRNDNVKLSISMTTRLPREGEVDGINYYFVSKEEFEQRIKDNKFLEYAIVHNGKYYGTPKDKVEEMLNDGKDVILEIDIQGALAINNLIPEAVFIFIMPPSMEILKERLINRNTETKEQILERFTKAYIEINEVSKYNYVVVNDEIDEAVNKIEAILKAEKCSVDRIEDVDLNNKEELIHELIVNEL